MIEKISHTITGLPCINLIIEGEILEEIIKDDEDQLQKLREKS